MEIIRDNKTIVLTEAELERAYREQETNYRAMDVKSQYETMYDKECPYNDSTCEKIGERAHNLLGKDDLYWDCYWDAVITAIEEVEKGGLY